MVLLDAFLRHTTFVSRRSGMFGLLHLVTFCPQADQSLGWDHHFTDGKQNADYFFVCRWLRTIKHITTSWKIPNIFNSPGSLQPLALDCSSRQSALPCRSNICSLCTPCSRPQTPEKDPKHIEEQLKEYVSHPSRAKSSQEETYLQERPADPRAAD